MKRWVLFFLAAILAGLLTRLEHTGSDVAKLEPVELLYVERYMGLFVVTTDTGQQGQGPTARQALEDLEQTSVGQIYLGTAEHLLLSDSARDSISRFAPFLRPDCTVTLAQGSPDLEKAAAYLDSHSPGVTLNDLRAGERAIPLLKTGEGGMSLEKP